MSNIVFVLFLVASHTLFMPLHVLGIFGLPRRVFDYSIEYSWFSHVNLFGLLAMVTAFILFPFTIWSDIYDGGMHRLCKIFKKS